MTNPDNAVGTNGAFGGRTSVNAFNDVLASLSGRGVLSGWGVVPDTGMTVAVGGASGVRDVAIAEDASGNRTTVNNISGASIAVTMPAAPSTGTRVDSIVVYVGNPPQGEETAIDNPAACGIIAVAGGSSAPNDSAIRAAITADGGSGSVAYYAVIANVSIASGTTDITTNMIQGGMPLASGALVGQTTVANGTLYVWRVAGNLYFLTGSFSNPTANVTVPFPRGLKGATGGSSQVFTLYASGMNTTKAYINNSSTNLVITATATSGNYALSAVARLA